MRIVIKGGCARFLQSLLRIEANQDLSLQRVEEHRGATRLTPAGPAHKLTLSLLLALLQDEILKAAIVRGLLFALRQLDADSLAARSQSTARTSGPASRRSWSARRPSNARRGGWSGSTRPSRRPSGPRRRTRSSSTSPSSCRPSGAPSRPSSGAPPTSASSATRSSSTRLSAPKTRSSASRASTTRGPARTTSGA